MRSKAPAIALLLATAVALGQEAAPAPQVPVFSERVEVRVLDLDVDVTDSKGQPVTDLKREDFTVKIGGKAMTIDYFARVADGTIHSPDLATASPDQVLAAYTKGGEATVPRNFLIYIDLGFISPGIRNRSINTRLHSLERSFAESITAGKKDDAGKAFRPWLSRCSTRHHRGVSPVFHAAKNKRTHEHRPRTGEVGISGHHPISLIDGFHRCVVRADDEERIRVFPPRIGDERLAMPARRERFRDICGDPRQFDCIER